VEIQLDVLENLIEAYYQKEKLANLHAANRGVGLPACADQLGATAPEPDRVDVRRLNSPAGRQTWVGVNPARLCLTRWPGFTTISAPA